MKKILVPTDFSPASKKATDFAVALAELYHSKIILIHNYQPLMYDPEVAALHIEEMNKIREFELKKLEAEKKRIDKKLSEPSTTVFAQGTAKETILLAEKKSSPSLIVMGTTGASELEKFVFGSVSLGVATGSNKPVLIVPEKAQVGKIKKIVYATDYHPADMKALKFIIDLAKKVDAKIYVVHVAADDLPASYEKNDLEGFKKTVLEKHDFDNISFHLIKGDKVASEIEKFCKKVNANLLSVSNEKRSFFLRLLIPSITKKMVYHSEIPILVFAGKS